MRALSIEYVTGAYYEAEAKIRAGIFSLSWPSYVMLALKARKDFAKTEQCVGFAGIEFQVGWELVKIVPYEELLTLEVTCYGSRLIHSFSYPLFV